MPKTDAEPAALRSADTAEFIPPEFGVTEETTKHLRIPVEKREAPHST